MTNAMKFAVFILFCLFAACAVFFVRLQKDEIQSETKYFLVKHSLDKYVEFGSVSVPVFSKAILKNVRIKSSPTVNFPNVAGRFEIEDFEEKQFIPTYFKAKASGVSFSLLEVVRNRGIAREDILKQLSGFNPKTDFLKHPLYAFLLAGCDDVKADISVEYIYHPVGKKLFLKVGVSDRCLGRLQAGVWFGNISNAQQGRLLTALRTFLTKGCPIFDIEEFLKGAWVTSLTLEYTAGTVIEGYKSFIDTTYLRQPDQTSIADIGEKGIQEIVSYLSYSNAQKLRNTEIARNIASFIKNPGTIAVTSRPDKQVDLSVLKGDPYRRFVELLLRLDVTVTAK